MQSDLLRTFVPQVLTKDSVTVAVDAVVYYRVYNATTSITNVEDANRSTRLLAATTLRNVLGTKNLSEILADREAISHQMQVTGLYDSFPSLHTHVYSGHFWIGKLVQAGVLDCRMDVSKYFLTVLP